MRKYLTLILSLLALMCALCVSALAEAPEPEQAAGKLYIKTIDEIDILEAQRLAEAQDAQSPVNTENWEAAKRTLKQGNAGQYRHFAIRDSRSKHTEILP